MNYYCARKRQADNRWDFTRRNDDRIWPEGYCAGWMTWTEEIAARIHTPLADLLRRQEENHGRFREKFHEDGHASPEEADACFYQYELDHMTESNLADMQVKCSVCSAWTSKGLQSRLLFSSPVMLCDEHRTVEMVKTVYSFHPGLNFAASW